MRTLGFVNQATGVMEHVMCIGEVKILYFRQESRLEAERMVVHMLEKPSVRYEYILSCTASQMVVLAYFVRPQWGKSMKSSH